MISRFSELPVISLPVDLAMLAGPYATPKPLYPHWGKQLWFLSEGYPKAPRSRATPPSSVRRVAAAGRCPQPLLSRRVIPGCLGLLLACLWHEVPGLVSSCLGSYCLSTKYLTVQELAAGGNQRGDNLSHLLHFNCLREPDWIQSRYASCPQMTMWSHCSSLVSIQLKKPHTTPQKPHQK